MGHSGSSSAGFDINFFTARPAWKFTRTDRLLLDQFIKQEQEDQVGPYSLTSKISKVTMCSGELKNDKNV